MMREAAQRREIATELHDLVGQDLVACRFTLGQIRTQLSPESLQIRKMEESCQLLDTAIQAARTLVFDLSPPMLHEIGLASALEWLAERYTRTYGLRVNFELPESIDPLPENIRILFFQTARELLANVVKHSEASEAILRTGRTGLELHLSLEDNGRGFPAAGGSNGFGLTNISDRFQHFGGTLDIRTSEEGSTLQVSIPLPTE
jgi:signal transduction histidine kinase